MTGGSDFQWFFHHNYQVSLKRFSLHFRGVFDSVRDHDVVDRNAPTLHGIRIRTILWSWRTHNLQESLPNVPG